MKTTLFSIALGCMVCLLACKKDIPDEKIKIVTDTVIVRDTVVVTDTVVIHDTVCIETTKYMWTRLADFPFGAEYFYDFPSFVAQGNIYFLHNTTVYKYDTGNNTWSNINPFPVARDSYFAFSVGSYGFVGSSPCDKYDCAKTPLLWRYTPNNDTFIPIDTLPNIWVDIEDLTINLDNKTLFLFYRSWEPKPKILEYDAITNQWTQKQNYPFSNTPEISFAINNRLYAVFANEGNTSNNKVYEYNPDTDVWTEKSNFQGAKRRGANSFALNNKGYLYGGTYGNGHTDLRDMWQYNPATNQWQQLPDVPFSDTWNHNVATIEDTAYIFDNHQTWKFTVEQSTKKIKQ